MVYDLSRLFHKAKSNHVIVADAQQADEAGYEDVEAIQQR
jgi:hypothetical protein